MKQSSQEDKHISDFKLSLIGWFSKQNKNRKDGKTSLKLCNPKKKEEIPDNPQPVPLKTIKLFTNCLQASVLAGMVCVKYTRLSLNCSIKANLSILNVYTVYKHLYRKSLKKYISFVQNMYR